MVQRVLVVDRDRATVEVVAQVAGDLGVECEHLPDSARFPQRYEAFRPDVVLFEIMLPDFDGLEIIDWLADRVSDSRLVILSDDRRSNVRSALALARAHGLSAQYLPKPLIPEMLREVLS